MTLLFFEILAFLQIELPPRDFQTEKISPIALGAG